MKYVVDRIEGKIVVCNNMVTGEDININKSILPIEVKEGDVIVKIEDKFNIDKNLTLDRYNDLTDRMNKLFNRTK